MDLWVEYFLRHHIPLPSDYSSVEIFSIIRSEPDLFPTWKRFLFNNINLIRTRTEINNLCLDWTRNWITEVCPSDINIREQQRLIFTAFPNMFNAWENLIQVDESQRFLQGVFAENMNLMNSGIIIPAVISSRNFIYPQCPDTTLAYV